MRRDPKGLFEKALAGEIENFTGISDPYEEPLNPEVVIKTDSERLEESAAKVIAKLEELRYIPKVAPEGGSTPSVWPNQLLTCKALHKRRSHLH